MCNRRMNNINFIAYLSPRTSEHPFFRFIKRCIAVMNQRQIFPQLFIHMASMILFLIVIFGNERNRNANNPALQTNPIANSWREFRGELYKEKCGGWLRIIAQRCVWNHFRICIPVRFNFISIFIFCNMNYMSVNFC
jgi:hypothetical protein